MIKENLSEISKKIPEHVTLIAVSKTKPISVLEEAYKAGQRHFGENKVQELSEKHAHLPEDIQWHFIGHLQTNKVKYIASFVHLIHSVDSLKLLKEINKEAKKNNRKIDCLLQFHIAQEETKFGLSLSESKQIISSEDYKEFKNINIVGVMGMASFTDNLDLIKSEFQLLNGLFEHLQENYFSENINFKEISMGMSNDYNLAIKEGSTMVRVGSSIFGVR